MTNTTGLVGYHPEMGEARPEAKIDAQLAHGGKHWYLKTPLTLTGRGVTLIEVLKAENLVPQAKHKAGWFRYKVTDAAFDRICKEHRVATEMLL